MAITLNASHLILRDSVEELVVVRGKSTSVLYTVLMLILSNICLVMIENYRQNSMVLPAPFFDQPVIQPIARCLLGAKLSGLVLVMLWTTRSIVGTGELVATVAVLILLFYF